MAKNNFKAFALDPNANVMSQADWEMLPVLLSGFTAGKASSSQVNKALRQSSTIAAVIAQFMADKTGQDVLDNGNTSQLQTIFASAIQGRLINVRVFTSSGTYTPTDGTKSIIVEVQGGGGGGGNTKAASSTNYTLASSGGAGGYAKSRITPVAASYTVTVGSGGQGVQTGEIQYLELLSQRVVMVEEWSEGIIHQHQMRFLLGHQEGELLEEILSTHPELPLIIPFLYKGREFPHPEPIHFWAQAEKGLGLAYPTV